MPLEANQVLININKFIRRQSQEKMIQMTKRREQICFQLDITIYLFSGSVIKPLYNIMIKQSEAENNLAIMSQRTNYITDWTDNKLKKYRQIQKNIIPEQNQQYARPKLKCKRQKEIIKEVSEKYDLKKCQKKLKAINQLELPLPHQNLFKLQNQYRLSRQVIESSHSNLVKSKKAELSYRYFEGEFLKRKLKHFSRKNIQSQKDLHFQQKNHKPPSLPRLFKEKKMQKLQFQKQRHLVTAQEIQKIKRAITKQSKRYSVPLIISEAQGLPLIKGLLY